MKTDLSICICGGGSLGHVVAGFLAATQPSLSVNILTGRPHQWGKALDIHTPEGSMLQGSLHVVSADAAEVIPQADVVLLCLPGFAIRPELERIAPWLKQNCYVGGIFCSTGFFFEAQEVLPAHVHLWGFQRVPFIARTREYGHSANLLGYKDCLKIAVERAKEAEKEDFRQWVEHCFGKPTELLGNYLEASLTNSNPLLHTSRLYTMFSRWQPGVTYPRMIKFYEEWTVEAAQLYIEMDKELFQLLKVLPVSSSFLTPALEYYESTDAPSLCRKISSIAGFQGITSPMTELASGQWVPDFQSRYFTEDFGLSLRYIWQLCREHGIDAPYINKVYAWGAHHISTSLV